MRLLARTVTRGAPLRLCPQLDQWLGNMAPSEKQLPYAADATLSLSAAELDVLREQYASEEAKGWVSTQTTFNLAWGLVKSTKRPDMAQGVALLMEVYRQEPSRRRECLYYLSLGHYKLGNYDEAKRYNDTLLEKEPNNMQARSLQALIEKGVTTEGYIGLGLVGGAAVVGSLLIASLVRAGRR